MISLSFLNLGVDIFFLVSELVVNFLQKKQTTTVSQQAGVPKAADASHTGREKWRREGQKIKI